jgi:hypothetical protein
MRLAKEDRRQILGKGDRLDAGSSAASLLMKPERWPREPATDWPSSIVSWVSKWLRVRWSEVPAYARLNGRDRNRLPVAANTALPTAGAIPGVPISPTPPIGAPEFAISTVISGASSSVTT